MNDKRRYPKNPLRNPTQKHLRKVFGDLPVVDATSDLKLFPQQSDFASGVPLDPHRCGFARCGRRQVGATAALVFFYTSYFDHVGEDGVQRIYRYSNGTRVRSIARKFDRRGASAVNTDRAFIFHPPSHSNTLRRQRAKGRRLRRSPRGKLLINTWMTGRRLQDAERDLGNMTEKLERLSISRSPAAPSVVETKTQIQRLRTRVRELRDDYHDKAKRADKVRIRPAIPKTTKAHNLNIRNGIGAMSALRA